MSENYFQTLNAINVNGKTEQKNGLTYLSWAWAWGEVKKLFPDATYTVYENENGWNYFTDGKTCWVKTGVTVNGIEHIEYLPVMDFKNKSIPLNAVTSFEVNKAIQRSLTKAIARHGLGLYIYAGEDLPEEEKQDKEAMQKPSKEEMAAFNAQYKRDVEKNTCKDCGKLIYPVTHGGKTYSVAEIAENARKTYKAPLCWACMTARRKANESPTA